MASENRRPIEILDGLLAAARLAQIVAVAAQLGIPDELAGGTRDAEDLATATGTNQDALYRLLATLAAGGVLHEDNDRKFRLTEVGELLRRDVPGSRRDWAILNGRPYVREAWSNLEQSIRTGENAFAALHGEGLWEWRVAHPEEGANFNRAMAENSSIVATAVADAFDFGSLGTLVDVGGGTGSLLAAILRRHTGLRGVLFDQPDVVASPAVAELLDRDRLTGRCRIVAGSFFESVPPGAGGYLMKSILHDWEDEPSIRILETIRAAAPRTSRLFVVEQVLGEPNMDLAGRLLDLQMLVLPGGRERTEEEWRSLFGRGGFELVEVRATGTASMLLIGSAAT
jgi:hypothetical protein